MTEKDLRNILEDLGPKDFKDFKWYLKYEKVDDLEPIKESKLSEAERRDVVDLMVQKYELAGAVDVFKSILKAIDRNDLVRKLLNISSGAKGQSQEKTNMTSHPDSSSVRRNSPDNQERVLQRKLHTFSLPPGELHLTWRRTNSPQNPKPTDQPSTSHSQIERLQNEVQIHISDKIRQAGGAGEKLLYHKTTQDSCDSSMTTGFNRHFAGQNGNQSDNKVNLVLLGMSATGKSESGNTILGRRQFVSRTSLMPVTAEWQVAETEINGTYVRVIDIPDIFDDEIKSSVKKQHVTKCKQLLQSGPCVFLLVMNVSRFTDGERDILRKFEEAFGSRAKEQTVILFTHGENLQCANMNLEDFLQDCHPELKNIVDQCGRRCVVFDNFFPLQHQVEELMQTVNTMLNKYQNQ